MSKNCNKDVRAVIAESGFLHKEVAELLGISANSFSRLLGKELREGRKYEIKKTIERALEQIDKG